MNAMIYNGYVARVEYDDHDKICVGRLAGMRDVVSFHGESVAELQAAGKRLNQWATKVLADAALVG